MNSDNILEIGIDDRGCLYVKPALTDFSHIYRAAMEVNWSPEGKFLYSPKPREWSYLDWYKQIHAATKNEYGVALVVAKNTKWVGIENELKDQIVQHSPNA